MIGSGPTGEAPGTGLAPGPVLSLTVDLFRNFAGEPFCITAPEGRLRNLRATLLGRASGCGLTAIVTEEEAADQSGGGGGNERGGEESGEVGTGSGTGRDVLLLREQGLGAGFVPGIPAKVALRGLAHRPFGETLLPENPTALFVNGTEHLQWRCRLDGRSREAGSPLPPPSLFPEAMALFGRARQELDLFSAGLPPFAQGRFGHLTSLPSLAGLGLCLSASLHLPATVLGRQLPALGQAAEALGLQVLPFEGDPLSGLHSHRFTVARPLGLLRSEDEALRDFLRRLDLLLDGERSLWKSLLQKEKTRLEDRIFRSRASLREGRLLSFPDLLRGVSDLRLGFYLGLLDGALLPPLEEALVRTAPAHLGGTPEGEADFSEDFRRAAMVRFLFGKA